MIQYEVVKMKRICFGTIITLIYQSRTRSADTIKSMCDGIFAAYYLDITSYNKELPSHLKSGHELYFGKAKKEDNKKIYSDSELD